MASIDETLILTNKEETAEICKQLNVPYVYGDIEKQAQAIELAPYPIIGMINDALPKRNFLDRILPRLADTIGIIYTDVLLKDGDCLIPNYGTSYNREDLDNMVVNSPIFFKKQILEQFNIKIDTSVKYLHSYSLLMSLRNSVIIAHMPEPLFIMDKVNIPLSQDLVKIRTNAS